VTEDELRDWNTRLWATRAWKKYAESAPRFDSAEPFLRQQIDFINPSGRDLVEWDDRPSKKELIMSSGNFVRVSDLCDDVKVWKELLRDHFPTVDWSGVILDTEDSNFISYTMSSFSELDRWGVTRTFLTDVRDACVGEQIQLAWVSWCYAHSITLFTTFFAGTDEGDDE
jgi:hypothetical protein